MCIVNPTGKGLVNAETLADIGVPQMLFVGSVCYAWFSHRLIRC